MYSTFVCQRVVCVCVPDMLTPFVLPVDDAGMCELEPCLACQSDKELVRGVAAKTHESAVEPHRHLRGLVSRLCAETFLTRVLFRYPLPCCSGEQQMIPSQGPYGSGWCAVVGEQWGKSN